MSRLALSLALAVCVGVSTARAEEGSSKGKSPPERPAVKGRQSPERVVVPSIEARERPGEVRRPGAWWLDDAGAQPRPPARRQAARRERLVHPLENAPATEVGKAITELFRAERQGVPSDSPMPVIVPDVISNCLIISATPDDLREIQLVAKELDRRPPMVLVKMLIAEATSSGGDAKSTAKPTADKGSRKDKSQIVGLPKQSTFSVERLEKELTLRVLDRPAGSKKGDIQIRELRKGGRYEVISRPQLLALDNQAAFVQVGRREPFVRGSAMARGGRVNQVDYEDVGIKLALTPRISIEGQVTLEMDLEMSRVGAPEDGVPVSVSETGEATYAPRIITTTSQTTVTVDDGQTVVLAGMSSDAKPRQDELLIMLTVEVVE